MKKKIRITWVYEYEPVMEYYPGATTVEECLKIDEANGDNPLYQMEAGNGTITYEVVKGDSNV